MFNSDLGEIRCIHGNRIVSLLLMKSGQLFNTLDMSTFCVKRSTYAYLR